MLRQRWHSETDSVRAKRRNCQLPRYLHYSTCIKPSRAITRFSCPCSAFSAVCFRPAAFKQPQHPAPPPRAFPVPLQQLCCRCVTRQCHKCPAVAPPHTARACRVHAPRRPFMARLAASSQLPAVHCCRRRHPARRLARDIACFRLSLPQKNMQQAALALFVASVLKSRLRTKPLGGFHAASQLLLRSHAHHDVPSLTRSRNWRTPSPDALALLGDFVMCEEKRALLHHQ